jgi:membrane protein DedA with SNARE-associated domain
MYKLIIVFFVAMLGIWKAVPIGILLHAPPVLVCIFTVAGASVSAAGLFFFGYRFKEVLQRRMSYKRMEKKQERGKRLLDHYGVIGLGIFGTILLGPAVTVIIGVLVSNERKKVFIWTGISILVWSVVLTSVAAVSMELFDKLHLLN